MIHIDLDKARILLKQAVHIRGLDFVYEKPDNSGICQYMHADGPGCGVGLALSLAGVRDEDIASCDGLGSAHHALSFLRDAGILTFDGSVSNYLDQFQRWQDYGYSWGESLDYAEERIAEQS